MNNKNSYKLVVSLKIDTIAIFQDLPFIYMYNTGSILSAIPFLGSYTNPV